MEKKKTILKRVIRILISAVLIVILCYNIDFRFVLDEIMSMRPWFLACVILLAAAGVACAVYKWRILLPQVPIVPFFKAFLYGCFFTLVLPGQVFGEAAKIVIFGKYTDRYDRSISTVVIDKITGVITLLITGLTGLLFAKAELPGALTAIMIVCVIALLAILFSLRIKGVHRMALMLASLPKKISPKLSKVSDSAGSLVETWREYLYKPILIAKSIAIGMVFNVALLSQFIIVCWHYEIPVGVIDLCWIMAVVNVVQTLPISLAGIGVRDASLVSMFAYIGIPAESAMILAVVLLLVIIFRAIAGAVCILYDMVKAKDKA